MVLTRPGRLATFVFAAALLLAPALRVVCDTVCARPAPEAHCEGGEPSEPADGRPGIPEPPEGCRHSDDVVLARTHDLPGVAGLPSLPLADLAPSPSLAFPPAHAPACDMHRRRPPSAAAQAPAILRL